MSPTQRSLKELKERDYFPQVVEHFNYFIKRRIDLFGFIDILAIKGEQVLVVQTTSGSHLQERVKKILNNENYKLVKDAGWKIEVHGWRKIIVGKYKNGNKKMGWRNKMVEL